MGSDWEQWPPLQRKSKHLFVKTLALVLLLALSFRLLFSRSAEVLPAAETTVAAVGIIGASDSRQVPSADSAMVPAPEEVMDEQDPQSDTCDLFTGEWIPNPSGPAYTNGSCKFIESPQDCLTNGRPDMGYLYWRWKPLGCDVPSFNAKKFLDAMRNKTWALIGDSILRNHAQSLLCLLSKEEEAVLVYHDDLYRSRRWHFSSHNFTLSLIWSPFLIKSEIFENEYGEASSENRLHLDILDEKWTSEYNNFDYVVISGGQWFLKYAIYVENNTAVGCHRCSKLNLTEVSYEYAFRKALQSVFRFVTISEHKPIVLYRTWTPAHFEHGEWFSGGVCNRTVPYKIGEFSGKDIDNGMRKIELEEFDRVESHDGLESSAYLKLLDTYQLSLMRPDGHSGPYRTFHPFADGKKKKVQNDCLHWCMPGAIDTWNELIMELILNQ